MKKKGPKKLTRRAFLRLGLIAVPAVIAGDAFLIEPRFVAVRRLRVAAGGAPRRLVHITDLHYRGDRRYLTRVVNRINALSPEFVCLTGDIVEDRAFLTEALDILGQIDAPVFASPGNHEHWSGVSLSAIDSSLRAVGGGLLVNERRMIDGNIEIVGVDDLLAGAPRLPERDDTPPGTRSILLTHCPAYVDRVKDERFDLILAGHSHGGQVRLPIVGTLALPGCVGRYDRGRFETPAGPLYVNVGLGTYGMPVRFLCRPEIVVIELG